MSLYKDMKAIKSLKEDINKTMGIVPKVELEVKQKGNFTFYNAVFKDGENEIHIHPLFNSYYDGVSTKQMKKSLNAIYEDYKIRRKYIRFDKALFYIESKDNELKQVDEFEYMVWLDE